VGIGLTTKDTKNTKKIYSLDKGHRIHGCTLAAKLEVEVGSIGVTRPPLAVSGMTQVADYIKGRDRFTCNEFTETGEVGVNGDVPVEMVDVDDVTVAFCAEGSSLEDAGSGGENRLPFPDVLVSQVEASVVVLVALIDLGLEVLLEVLGYD
jgi:hypothetical protein